MITRLFFEMKSKTKNNMQEDVIAAMRTIIIKLKGYSHYRGYEQIDSKRFLVSLMKINGKWSLSITQV